MSIIKLVLKNLIRRPGRFLFTMLGITIGMASFVALLSMGDNLRAEVTTQAEALGADLIVTSRTNCPFEHLAVLSGELMPEAIHMDVVREIGELEGIHSVIPYLTVGGSIEQELVSVTGILPEEMKEHRQWSIMAGSSIPEDGKQVSIGAGLSEQFQLEVGDYLTFRGVDFQIAGILNPTQTNDDRTVFMPLVNAQEVYELGEYVSYVAVTVDDVTMVEEHAAMITDISNVSVLTDEELLGSVLLILGSVNDTLQMIAGVALMAAAFGIINTMMTAIYERRREIGILRAMGSKGRTIFKIFVLESGLYGLLGGLTGLLVGVLVSRFAAPLIQQNQFVARVGGSEPVVNLSPLLILTVLTLSIGISIVSGLYPAWKASKLTPMEAIRNV